MWIMRASRGRLEWPLSCREVSGIAGLVMGIVAGCWEEVVVCCVGGESCPFVRAVSPFWSAIVNGEDRIEM